MQMFASSLNKDLQERELEDLLIDGISGGAVGGKLDQKSRVFEVILYKFLFRKNPNSQPKYCGSLLTFIYHFSGQVDFVSGRDIRKMDIGNIVDVLQSWYCFKLIQITLP